MNDSTPLLVRRHDLDAAAEAGLIAPQGVAALWRFLGEREGSAAPTPSAGPRFDLTHLLYYFGGLLAIGAATLFLTLAVQQLSPWALLAVCLGYGAGCVAAARWLDARGLAVPAGILATLAVCLVPLATWALQSGLGLWPPGGPERVASFHTLIDWRWLTMEFATLAAAAVALWSLRHPFLTMPVAVTLWYMSMDLAEMLLAPVEPYGWEFRRDFSMFFGLGMTLLAFWIDWRSRATAALRGTTVAGRDFAFWLYWLGMLTFWCALSARPSAGELAKLAYATLNLGFVFVGVVLSRRVFTLCGGLGVAVYLGHLSWRVFENSLLFPVALTAIGLGIVALGVLWHRNEARWNAALLARLPPALRRFQAAAP
jgi:hypothetical protein